MELKQIKLAGFKSFVDPTVLDLRSELVAVVGPNGCGKSNVIDAVRWVMGESSAKNLRGESITDVIFNGSNTRKPIGQASIELVFDNSDGKIGGEYSAYAEICVRREVNRDAVSNYYLNGTRCRRRDIIDAFLGTGVGSRSYSIIEQGMISRVIESKPEDLRKFVEEAAGISVYKKRRHDTELRMRHTTENMARLEDLREEQIKLLERLHRQAESAKKYQTFSKEKDLLEAQLLALRWQGYDQQLSQFATQIRDLTVAVEEQQAARTSVATETEKVQLEHVAQKEIHDKVQSHFYELGSQIARNEQSLQHYKQRRQQLSTDDQQIKDSIVEITAQKDTDSNELFACEEQLEEINPKHAAAEEAYEQAEELYQDAHIELTSWNEDWEKFQLESQAPQQEAEVQKAKIEHLEQQTRDLQARITKLQQESDSLDLDGIEQQVTTLTTESGTLEQETSTYREEITELQHSIGSKRDELQQQQDQLNEVRNVAQQAKGREASLQALQQAALGKDNKVINDWLGQHNLQNAPRLAESLSVESGWQQAVETVLADYLEAVCIDSDLDAIANGVSDLSAGQLILIDNAASSINAPADSLASKVTGSVPLAGILANVLVADDLPAALQLRGQLTEQQTVITRDGIWLGKNWLRVRKDKDATSGVIEREQELQALQAQLEDLASRAQEYEDNIAELNASLRELEIALTSKQQVERDSAAKLRDCSSKLSAAEQKYEHAKHRRQRILQEISELKLRATQHGEGSTTARLVLEAAIDTMAELSTRKEELQSAKDRIYARERETKLRAKDLRDELHDLEIQKQTVTTKYAGLQHTITRVDQQLSELHKRHQQVTEELAQVAEPIEQIQEELDRVVADRAQVDQEFQQARRDLEALEAKLQEYNEQRLQIDGAIEKAKESLSKIQLEKEGLEVRKETVNEQLSAAQVDLQKVITELPEEADAEQWASRIATLTKRIENLGAINLAAVEELEAESQRQEYLESQHKDLQEALNTLENAIKKIDRETRAKFQETFEKINNNFVQLFPKLFGGGKATLEVVGDDLLEAGVTVIAQPPGKKNSTIHLLSGGEKALTAVSLVFAIFQLNPAPFCMLDEVDAPLDDTNVNRFGALIKEMSEKVQFIIITHNKATMEIANQLIGVTMKEPGVSRLVSVDINEAVAMVD